MNFANLKSLYFRVAAFYFGVIRGQSTNWNFKKIFREYRLDPTLIHKCWKRLQCRTTANDTNKIGITLHNLILINVTLACFFQDWSKVDPKSDCDQEDCSSKVVHDSNFKKIGEQFNCRKFTLEKKDQEKSILLDPTLIQSR